MIGGQDQGVGEIPIVLDQAAPGIAADKRNSGGHHGRFLEIADGYTNLLPAINAQDGSLGMTEQGFVDGHVGGCGGFGVEEKTAAHGSLKFKLKLKLKKVRRLSWEAGRNTFLS
jgi:hypothetical protein